MHEQRWEDQTPPDPLPEERRVPPGQPPHDVQVDTPDQPPAPPSHWSIWETLPLVLFILLMAAMSLTSGPQPKASTGAVRAILVLQTVLYAVFLLYIHYIVSVRHHLPFWRGLSWRRVNPVFFIACGLALAMAVQLLSLPENRHLPIERLFQTRGAVIMLAIFGTTIAPFVEEVIFRGFIFGAVEARAGLTAAVWITALLFAAIHVPQLRGGTAQILAIFGVGLVLSWARARTRSLAASYFMHLGYNGTLFLMLFIATSGFRNLSGV